MNFNKILIIQTAFIGDVVLATPLVESIRRKYPEAQLDFLLRKGNENLLQNDKRINNLIIWDKKKGKFRELYRLIKVLRENRYDCLINVQRFATTGFLTSISGARYKIGFDKNPFSMFFDLKVKHEIGAGIHEIQRNLKLVESISDFIYDKPSLQIPNDILEKVKGYKIKPYLVIAPTSVWFTKQFPKEKWIDFLDKLKFDGNVFFIGGNADKNACDEIINGTHFESAQNLCGKLSLIESVALIKDAIMNYVNDSAPMHFASAVNANTTVVYCSTVPEFGFGPLADNSTIIENPNLNCRPCGLHGFTKCPEAHFKCALDIDTDLLLNPISSK